MCLASQDRHGKEEEERRRSRKQPSARIPGGAPPEGRNSTDVVTPFRSTSPVKLATEGRQAASAADCPLKTARSGEGARGVRCPQPACALQAGPRQGRPLTQPLKGGEGKSLAGTFNPPRGGCFATRWAHAPNTRQDKATCCLSAVTGIRTRRRIGNDGIFLSCEKTRLPLGRTCG